ncbi:Uncharacterised protein [Vibrio cholerae]|nr:Uncharacterised protein [Vibrio cholerae]
MIDKVFCIQVISSLLVVQTIRSYQDLSKPLITRLKLKFQSHSFSHPVWIYCLILCLMLCKVVLR